MRLLSSFFKRTNIPGSGVGGNRLGLGTDGTLNVRARFKLTNRQCKVRKNKKDYNSHEEEPIV